MLSRKSAGRLYYFINYCWRSLHDIQNLPRHPSPYVSIGRHTYGVRQGTIVGPSVESPVKIGHFCSIAPGVAILCHVGHPTDLPSTFPFRSRLFGRKHSIGASADSVTRGSVSIGDDVWVGQGAIILSGVTIGIGAVIGAGAVVTKNIPPYAIAAGNPAEIIRMRFEDDLIAQLMETAWWELPDSSLLRLEQVLYQPDIKRFVDAVQEERRLLKASSVAENL